MSFRPASILVTLFCVAACSGGENNNGTPNNGSTNGTPNNGTTNGTPNNSSTNGAPNNTTPTNVETIADADEGGMFTADVTAAAGGTLQSDGGSVVLTVPPGGVAADASLTLDIQPARDGGVTSVYQFGPDGLDFVAPAVLEIELPHELDGSFTPTLVTWNGSAWEPVPEAYREGNTITAPLLHFSDYCIQADPPDAPETIPCGSDADCPADQACNSTIGRCAAPGEIGAPCQSDDVCNGPLLCAPQLGVCYATGGLASPCSSSAECTLGRCHPNGFCADLLGCQVNCEAGCWCNEDYACSCP